MHKNVQNCKNNDDGTHMSNSTAAGCGDGPNEGGKHYHCIYVLCLQSTRDVAGSLAIKTFAICFHNLPNRFMRLIQNFSIFLQTKLRNLLSLFV